MEDEAPELEDREEIEEEERRQRKVQVEAWWRLNACLLTAPAAQFLLRSA